MKAGSQVRTTIVLLGALSALLTNLPATAQNEEDALRASMIAPGGTARSLGIANAFGALGADGACISINPAGMGLYRTSELSLTPGIEFNKVTSTYDGSAASNSKTRFNFSNLNLTLHSPGDKGSDWRSGTFGVVYDRQATAHWRRQASAKKLPTSILDAFAYEAEGVLADDLYDALPFSAGLAYDTYGIDPLDPQDTTSRSYVANLGQGSLVDQTHTIDSRGAISTTSFFYSGNYMDRLYLGISLGIVGVRYTHTMTHSETTVNEDLKDLRYKEDLTINGNGIDVKAGVVYRFHSRFRGGLAFHSPRWMQLNDVYVHHMNTNFITPDSEGRTAYTASSPEGNYSYRTHSPLRVVASAAYIAGEHGLISVDYEYADYGNMRYKPSNELLDPYDFAAENAAIVSSFRPVHAVRAGTEWRSGNWYFRMGGSITPDPYEESDPRHGVAQRTYTGGLGYRTAHLGVDLGVEAARRTSRYYPYDATLAGIINEQRSIVRSLVTVSIRP